LVAKAEPPNLFVRQLLSPKMALLLHHVPFSVRRPAVKTITLLLFVLMASISWAAAQTGDLTPADNLVTENLPKIPAALVEGVGRYTEFRAAGLADWHPTKREMLITTRFGDTAQIHHVKFPGGARTQLTFFPDSVGGAIYQPKQGNYFVFVKGSGGNERFQAYRYDLDTGHATLLTDGKSRNSGGVWSNAGDKVVYSSTRRNGADNDLYLIDPADPKTDRLLLELKGGGWRAADWSPDDSKILVGESISINESYLWLVDVASGVKTLITPKNGGEKIAYSGGQFTKDGKGLYVTTDKDAEFQRLAHLDLTTKQHSFLTDHIKWDIEEFELSHDGKTIAFIANEDGVGTLHLLDAATGKEKPAPKLPPGSVTGLKWHTNNKDLGLMIVSARAPSDVFSLDVETGKVDRWTTSETGGLNTSAFVEPELVRWKSFDERSISGFLYKPPAKFTGKRPVIINIHGGPEAQYRPGFLARNNYYLNELGVALLMPNVRGSSGYGKTFLTLDNGFKREDTYKDIGALLDWIKTRDDLDADRILVTGGSYGGHMTLAIAWYYPERIRCAVDIVGISNFVTFMENTESYRRDLRRVEYGDERNPEMREFMERIAPVNNAHKMKKPMFIIQGKNDPRVPLIEAEQMVATLKKQGTPVWYLMAKDEGHGFAKKKNADFQFYATVLFTQEFLLK
jgi:dipeptidyl aminopeptidase/acylaminoacyl peptidase